MVSAQDDISAGPTSGHRSTPLHAPAMRHPPLRTGLRARPFERARRPPG